MDRDTQQTFINNAASALALVRNSLLIIVQKGEAHDLSATRQALSQLKHLADPAVHSEFLKRVVECEAALDDVADQDRAALTSVYAILDRVARIEAALLDVPLRSEDFIDDLTELVDDSFDNFGRPAVQPEETFELDIDDETLEIFRTEADELLACIAENLTLLSNAPTNKSALWEVRRCAHTFKGAAGIVGYKDACSIAHQMEDLLDKVVEFARGAATPVIRFLQAATNELRAIVSLREPDEDRSSLESRYAYAMEWISSRGFGNETVSDGLRQSPLASIPTNSRELPRSTSTPVVRVSLDRLDELVKISRNLLLNRSALAERFSKFASAGPDPGGESKQRIVKLIEAANSLTLEIQNGLLQIRMVKFGTLETRLSRAVHSTCLDENKKAVVTIENGDVEIDTLVIDALIEPMLHLLKNAVVHGIEPPETRRLIGKPERGNIRISIEADSEAMVLTVTDDGGGILVPRLINKAIANGMLSEAEASELDEKAATKLIFTPGLTTTDKLDLNAGRGVGMAIVKDSIESRGGTVLVESQIQRGTTFTILMPLAETRPHAPLKPKPIDSQKPLVLIVDDSSTVRSQITSIVEEAGYRGITATNGADALELLLSSKWEPDLILSDVEMPQIDGWQFLEYVKTDANFGSIPVVMITSLDTAGCRKLAAELGASDYVTKPVNKDEIYRLLDEYCAVTPA
jgi:two-component system, chemotaxis family, sensor kinase CheA